MKYFLILLFFLTILIISIVISSSNNQIVTFNYLINKGNYPFSTLLAIIFAIGFILCWCICGLFYVNALITLSKTRRKIKNLENQIIELTKNKYTNEIEVITDKEK